MHVLNISHKQINSRGDAMVKNGNPHFSPKEIWLTEHENKLFFHSPKNVIFGVYKRENSENISIEIIYSIETMRRFILLVFIILISYLCYELELLDIIETALANLVTTLIIFLRKSPNYKSESRGI